MNAPRMHPDELDVDVALVRRLLAAQFPRWRDLPIEPVESAGTENAIFRLGEELAVRAPRVASARSQVEKECRWLPRLAPLLPLALPVPLEQGTPGEGYPFPWLVSRWVDGEPATRERIADLSQAALDLAGFVTSLQRFDRADAPSSARGLPLASRDEGVRAAITALDGAIDADAVTAAWEAAVGALDWRGPPVWTHGDLYDGNLLAASGRLSAVIDWSILGVGDPACDLIVAWSLFTAAARDVFRGALAVDDATWARGRGWALSVSLIALPYYAATNPVMVANARHRIDEILADQDV